MSLASTIRAAIRGSGPKAADNPAPEDEETKPDATEPEDKKPDAEGDKPEDKASGEEDTKPDASEDDPEEDAEDMPEDDKPAAAAERQRIGAFSSGANSMLEIQKKSEGHLREIKDSVKRLAAGGSFYCQP